MVLSYILLENIIEKENCLYHQILFTFLCVAGYLKHNNDVSILNIPKYTNYVIIEIYLNRLSTTNFHSDGLRDNDGREVPLF